MPLFLIVVCILYSQFKDPKTEVEFERREVGGLFVGVAEVDEKTAKAYEKRDGFHVYGKDEFAALSKLPEKEAAPPTSGDPLTDARADQAAALTEGILHAMKWHDVQALAKARGVDLKHHKSRADVTAALLALQEDETDTPNPLAGAPPAPPGTSPTSPTSVPTSVLTDGAGHAKPDDPDDPDDEE